MNSATRISALLAALVLCGLVGWIVFSEDGQHDFPQGENPAATDPTSFAEKVHAKVIPQTKRDGVLSSTQRVENKLQDAGFSGRARLLIHLQNRDSEPQEGHLVSILPRADGVSFEALQVYQNWLELENSEGVFTSDSKGDIELMVPNGVAFRLESSVFDSSGMNGRVVVPVLRPKQVYRITMLLREITDEQFFGRVVHASTNQPVPHVLIHGGRRLTQSNLAGLFRIARGRGNQVIKVEAEGFASMRLAVEPECTSIELAQLIRMEPEARVFGSVLRGNEKVAHAQVSFRPSWKSAVSSHNATILQLSHQDVVDSEGGFTVKGLMSNIEYHVDIQLPSVDSPLYCESILQFQIGENRQYDIQLADWSKIRGSIVCSDGSLASGAVVQARRLLSSELALAPGEIVDQFRFHKSNHNEYMANDLGEYYIPLLSPGRWKVGVLSERSEGQPWASQATIIDVPTGGGELRLDHFLQTGKFISGRVVNSAGVGLQRAEVQLNSLQGNVIHFHRRQYAGLEGEFRIGPLFDEFYQLELLANYGISGEASPDALRVQAGASGIELKTVVAAGFRLQVINSQGIPVSRGRAVLRNVETQRVLKYRIGENGIVQRKGVQPGRFILSVETVGSGIAWLNEVSLEVGVTKDFGKVQVGDESVLTLLVDVSEESREEHRYEVWVEADGMMVQIDEVSAKKACFIRIPVGTYKFELRQGGQVFCTETHDLMDLKTTITLTPNHEIVH